MSPVVFKLIASAVIFAYGLTFGFYILAFVAFVAGTYYARILSFQRRALRENKD